MNFDRWVNDFIHMGKWIIPITTTFADFEIFIVVIPFHHTLAGGWLGINERIWDCQIVVLPREMGLQVTQT